MRVTLSDMIIFFFSSRRRHTRCSRDWSSDVCSSDLAPAQTRHAKVKITVPANGATVSGPVKVVLVATGVEIVPATVERPGTGHHHLFVDHDLTPVDDTIPRGVTGILHL